MAHGHKRATVNVMVVGSISSRWNEILNMFIISESKRGVESVTCYADNDIEGVIVP